MQYGQIPGIDKKVSRLVQGTIMLREETRAESFALLDAVYEAGGNAFDTARHYAPGTESTFGKWVRERGLRDEVVVIGKGAHPLKRRSRVTPEDITSDLEESLKQFGFDYVDLYLLHRDDESVPVGPIVEVLDKHRREGKIRAYGGSNWSHRRIAEANAYAAEHGLAPFVATSPNLSLAVWIKPPWEGCITISGPAGEEARNFYREHNIAVLPWSTLAQGFFSGRFRRDNLDQLTDPYDKLGAESYGSEENFRRLDRAEALAKARGLTIPQVALAYVLSQPLNVFALVGPRTPAEVQDNAPSAEIRLTPEEVAYLELRCDELPA